MKKTRKILDRIVSASGFPNEVLPGISLVELAGDRRVLIENHKGVVAYGSSEIRIKTAYGSISVIGEGLELARMTREQLVITGVISAVSLFREEG